MPRRASSGVNTGQIVGLAAGVTFILVIAFLLFKILMGDASFGKSRDPGLSLSASSDLDIRAYLNNANSLRGNAYRVKGTVEEQLRWTPDRGRLISLEVDGASDVDPIPVLIPPDFSHVNIEKGGEFYFVIEVIDGGLLVAREVKQI